VDTFGEIELFVMSVQRRVINIIKDEKGNHKTEYIRLQVQTVEN
jgi:hypothetical protein